ncbi:MAG: hypothetical protein ABIK92_05245 [Pseudomonadota bacterium]
MKKVIFLTMVCFLFVVGSANASIVYNCSKPAETNTATLGPFTFDLTIAGDLTTPDMVTIGTTNLGTEDSLTTWAWPAPMTGPGTMAAGVLSVDASQDYDVEAFGSVYLATLRAFTLDTVANTGTFILSPFGGQEMYTWHFDATQAAPAVPIPGAVLLFGSGLLGLVGIKRKIKK